jgi:hypothetical protein
MTIAEIKQEIQDTYPLWKGKDSSIDGDKYASINEDYIREFIRFYCEEQGCVDEGFPTETGN